MVKFAISTIPCLKLYIQLRLSKITKNTNNFPTTYIFEVSVCKYVQELIDNIKLLVLASTTILHLNTNLNCI